MLNALRLLFTRDTLRDTMSHLRSDTCHRIDRSLTLRTSGDSVKSIYCQPFLVENPELKPQKDYQDYTKFVNEELTGRRYYFFVKSVHRDFVVSQSALFEAGRGLTTLNTLRTTGGMGLKQGVRSTSTAQTNRNSMSDGFQEMITDIKPKLLESKVSEQQQFFGLSDGFKKIFANDKKD